MIDRIAYSPYGEATRTLRSDVSGDGFVNQSDHTGVIRPRTGATIGTAAYVVEAGLFSKGVRNSLGYCGYVFNEDSGLYTVRFRTYSPTLGRWLERDPAGCVDGMGLYESVRGGPIAAVDPSGLSTATGGRWREDRQPPSSPNPLTLYWDGERCFNDTERARWRETGLYQKLCIEHALDVAVLINEDPKYAGGIVNGPGDAVGHCTWNCLMTKCLGRKGAQRWGDAHEESTPPGREDEREMDLHSNQQGRDIYSELFERNFEASVRSLPSDDCGFNAVGDVVPDTECKTACEEALAAGRLKVLEKSKWRDE